MTHSYLVDQTGRRPVRVPVPVVWYVQRGRVREPERLGQDVHDCEVGAAVGQRLPDEGPVLKGLRDSELLAFDGEGESGAEGVSVDNIVALSHSGAVRGKGK